MGPTNFIPCKKSSLK
jgi:hypothetical protein